VVVFFWTFYNIHNIININNSTWGGGAMKTVSQEGKSVIILDEGVKESLIVPLGCCVGYLIPYRGGW
jgi:hypothetical protein